jgi:hypothetical protein
MSLWSTSGTSAEASEPAHNDAIPQNRLTVS